MQITDLLLNRVAAKERLRDIAATIKPLPLDIAPSERFLRQTRRRLLALEDGIGRSSPRAA